MSREDVIREEQVRWLRTQLPTFLSTRDVATTAVAATAEEIGLDLSDHDVRALALAVVDAIEKGTELRGIEFAYSVIDREVNDTYRHLIAPATAKTAADPHHAPVLYAHQQYVSGMTTLRRRIGDVLLRAGKQWLGAEPPSVEAPPVVPLAAPAGAVEARERAAARVAAA